MNANGGVNMLLSSPNGLLHALDVLLISVRFIMNTCCICFHRW